MTERFTKVANDRLLYQFNVHSPSQWNEDWGGEYEFQASEGIYEYACHEGNYALEGILAGDALLQPLHVGSGQLRLCLEVIVGFAQKAGRAARPVVNPLADLGIDHLDHRADQRAREALGKKVSSGGNGPLPRDVAVGSVIGFWKKTFKL